MFVPKSPNTAFTICARNYFAQALTLARSFRQFHPESDFRVVLMDRKDPAFAARFPEVEIVWAEDLGLPGFAAHSLRFDVIEFSTNVKPHCLQLLLGAYEKVLYLDPDTCLYDRLDEIYARLDTASVVVTPATMAPVMDGHRPDDIEYLRVGVFNLGFVGVARGDEGMAFAKWWGERCLSDGFHETQLGVFVDQKWVNLAPCYFPATHILRDRGVNMAIWNLHERSLTPTATGYRVNDGGSLKLYHFSSFDPHEPRGIAKRQTRFAVGSRPDMNALVDDYAARVLAAGFDELSRIEYSYDYTPAGDYISPTLRRIYANTEYGFPQDEDPWREDSALMRFARRRKLIGKSVGKAKRLTANDVGGYGRQMKMIAMAFSLALRVFGPNRYFALMRYLAHASSIRKQPRL